MTQILFKKPLTVLTAKIRSDSKYSWQSKDYFNVSIDADCDGYVVLGGPGGRYRLSDVELFAETSSGLVKIA